MNTVTGKEGEGSGVLIRAVEPVIGISQMRKRRLNVKNDFDISNGPGKLCIAMDIDKSLNRSNITTVGKIFVSRPLKNERFNISVSKRIGISSEEAIDLPYRFFIQDNPFVTKHKFNKEILEAL